jgi:hypothetical protein
MQERGQSFNFNSGILKVEICSLYEVKIQCVVYTRTTVTMGVQIDGQLF